MVNRTAASVTATTSAHAQSLLRYDKMRVEISEDRSAQAAGNDDCILTGTLIFQNTNESWASESSLPVPSGDARFTTKAFIPLSIL
jgi:hypothetical protein